MVIFMDIAYHKTLLNVVTLTVWTRKNTILNTVKIRSLVLCLKNHYNRQLQPIITAHKHDLQRTDLAEGWVVWVVA